MDNPFYHCRICYEEDEEGCFLSIIELELELKKIFMEKFGIDYHHYMFNPRKVLLCVECYEHLKDNPTDDILQAMISHLRYYQREKFAEAEQKFFNWKFKPENDFTPIETDHLVERFDVEKWIQERHERLSSLPPAPKKKDLEERSEAQKIREERIKSRDLRRQLDMNDE